MAQGQEELPSLKAKVPGTAPPSLREQELIKTTMCSPKQGSLKVVHQVILQHPLPFTSRETLKIPGHSHLCDKCPHVRLEIWPDS